MDAPVPQIVITEASPLNQSAASSVENVAVIVPADGSARAAEPVSSDAAERKCEDSEEEYKAVEDCGQCVVPVPASSEAPVPEVAQIAEEAVTLVTRTETESEAADLRPMPGCCPDCGRCGRLYFKVADAFISVYSIPFWFVLLALPLSAGFMGGRYMNECPGRSVLPTLVFLLGVGGVILLSAQICCLISRSVCRSAESCIRYYTCHIEYIAGLFTFMILIAENVSFFTLEPDFRITSSDFCHPTFYEYTRWMSWIVWLVTLPILAIRGPASFINCYNRYLT